MMGLDDNGYNDALYFGTDKPLTKLKFGVEDIFYGSWAEELARDYMEVRYQMHLEFIKEYEYYLEKEAVFSFDKNKYFRFTPIEKIATNINKWMERISKIPFDFVKSAKSVMRVEHIYKVDPIFEFWYIIDKHSAYDKPKVVDLLSKRQFEWFLPLIKEHLLLEKHVKLVYCPPERDGYFSTKSIDYFKVDINNANLLEGDSLTDDNFFEFNKGAVYNTTYRSKSEFKKQKICKESTVLKYEQPCNMYEFYTQ